MAAVQPQAAVPVTPPVPVLDPASPVVVPPANDPADFDGMFAEWSRPEEDTPATPPAPKAKAAPEPVPEPAPEPVEEPAPEPAVEAAQEPAPRGSDDDLLARFAEIVHAKAQPDPRATPQSQLQPQPQPQVQEPYTPEERAFLAQYEKDWPDVVKAESLRRRAEYQQVVGYMFNEMASVLQPLMQQVQSLAERTQLADLHQIEPEYDNLRDKVVAWIDQQPAYLRPAYEYVRDHGTTDEVADLIARYRQATGEQAAPASVPASAAQPAREEPSLPAATKKAVASLAPVGSKRSVVVQSNDPSDFDGAFESFAKV